MNDSSLDARHVCTGLILAGGRGARMGGADKGLLELHGRPLAACALETLRPQTSQVLISANRNAERYAQLGAVVIADELADFQGPLVGMLAGLAQLQTQWLISVPCDMPDIPSNLAAKLLRAAAAGERRAAYAVFAGEPSYVCALLHRSLKQPLQDFLASGQRAVRAWLAAQDACAVSFAGLRTPLNINHASDLLRAAG